MNQSMAGKLTAFSELAQLCIKLRSTTKRLEKRAIIAEFLREIRSEEVSAATLLIIGKIFPESEKKILNVGWASLSKSLKGGRQVTLEPSPLTILDVQKILSDIADASGPDSTKVKMRLLKSLFGRATKEEREVILHNIFGEMRHGVAEGVMLEALADASNADVDTVRYANMLSGDIGKIAETALTLGTDGLKELSLQLFTPVKPMLAEEGGEISTAFKELGNKCALEFKFDGARIQIHKRGDDIKIFSRRLSNITESLPEIVSLVKRFGEKSFLVEGELIAIDSSEKPLPFQDLMRRFRRVHDIESAMKEVPLKLYLFDILFLNDRLIINESYEKRWEILSSIVDSEFLANRIIATTLEEIELFLKEALEDGHEGLMMKKLDSKYTPGKRGKSWLKIKQTKTLDVVVIGAEWGYGRRQGWLSNYHLAVRDGDDFAMVGKTFKGLTDSEFKWMTDRLLELKETEERWGVFVKPEIVVEVDFNEIQKSARYKSGFALRFARIKRIREDKTSSDTDTLEHLRELFEKQFERKGRISEI